MRSIVMGALFCALLIPTAAAQPTPDAGRRDGARQSPDDRRDDNAKRPAPGDRRDDDDKRPADDRRDDDKRPPGDRRDDDDKRPPGDRRDDDDKRAPGDRRDDDDKRPPGDRRDDDDKRPHDDRRDGDSMQRPPDDRRDDGPGRPGVRRTWKLDRPVISSYWPTKGDAGTKVVIRGRNFARGTEVLWAGAPIAGAKVTATEISFAIPRNAASGAITLRGGGMARPVTVGAFELTTYDAVAEAKRQEEERRKAAEVAWTARQKALAKDRAARDAALAQREEELRSSREDRRRDHQARIIARWRAEFLADEDTQDELALHAQRVSTIERMTRLAEARNDGKLVVRVEMALARENERHDQRMQALEAAFQSDGGSR